MARNLPRQGRSRRYGNVVPRSPAGPMDIGRSLRGPRPGHPPGGGRGFGPGKGMPHPAIMAQIQFLREAKNNLNTQHKQAMSANAAAGRPSGGKYTSGPLIGQPVPPNPTPGKIPTGPREGQPTRTSLRQGARSRINSQLLQLRAEVANGRQAGQVQKFRKQPRQPRSRKAYNTFT